MKSGRDSHYRAPRVLGGNRSTIEKDTRIRKCTMAPARVRLVDKFGTEVAMLAPTPYAWTKWRKSFADLHGKQPSKVAILLKLGGGERIVDTAASFRKLEIRLQESEDPCEVFERVEIPEKIEQELSGWEFWRPWAASSN